jgi:hypothetical protein
LTGTTAADELFEGLGAVELALTEIAVGFAEEVVAFAAPVLALAGAEETFTEAALDFTGTVLGLVADALDLAGAAVGLDAVIFAGLCLMSSASLDAALLFSCTEFS